MSRAAQALISSTLALSLCASPLYAPWALSAEPQATDAIVSGDAIEKALTRPQTDTLTGTGAGTKTRGIRVSDTARSKGVIDLNIPFELNSSGLQPQAIEQLRQLETALKSAALLHDRFLVAGHTDATGSAEYNRRLSLRRAAAVKDFLVGSGIEPERLQSTGEGASRLLAPDRPSDPVNRRVEISNLGRIP
jgi:outer membrane protein OmpA-like peptidoglycan-associated protein